MGHDEAVVSGASHRGQIGGFGQGVSNLGDVFAVARLALVAHTVGVGGVAVSAVKHVAIEFVLAELVLVNAVE